MADIVIASCVDLADRIEELTAVYATGVEAAVVEGLPAGSSLQFHPEGNYLGRAPA